MNQSMLTILGVPKEIHEIPWVQLLLRILESCHGGVEFGGQVCGTVSDL